MIITTVGVRKGGGGGAYIDWKEKCCVVHWKKKVWLMKNSVLLQ